MKKAVLSLTIASFGALAMMAGGKDADPVLMTVNKKPVKLSEFEYLYQKNNAQQLATQPVDEYLDLFVIYKLKVADAEAAGIDKNDAFINEFAGYRRDLSEPYLTDKEARDSIVRLMYDRMHTDVDVSHVMVDRGRNAAAKTRNKAMLDSIRTAIINGEMTLEAAADKYSIDQSKVRNHGHMGYIPVGMFPYTFEDAAYQTKVGEISPVIETPFGYHIVKVNGTRPAQGQVKVQHILKLTRDLPEEQQAVKKAQIDSIYNLVASGADFDDMAKRESEDTGSARNGGLIDFFGTGRMVPEFEETSFALKNGEISKPFATSYGYHIVKRLDWKGLDDFNALEPQINAMIDRDERQNIPTQIKKNKLRAKYNVTVNEEVASDIRRIIKDAGQLDTTLVKSLANDDRIVISLDGDNDDIIVADAFTVFPPKFRSMTAADAIEILDNQLEELAGDAAIEAERNNLATSNMEYRNLLNEYHDGMMLFEISDRNVWTRSKEDSEGIAKFFEANKAKYATWEAPKYKGYVIFATSDSIKNLAQNYLAENPVAPAQLIETLKAQYGKDIKVERVLAAEGENAIIDGIAFGKEAPKAPTGKWVAYFGYAGKVIAQPEEVADERGAVTTDYQASLEQNWVKDLRKKYPVKVNKKVLKQYKESLGQK